MSYREPPPATPVRSSFVAKAERMFWMGVHAAVFGAPVFLASVVVYLIVDWMLEPGDIPVQIEHSCKSDVVRVRVYDVWGQAEHLDTYATCSARLSKRYQDRCREVGWAP